METHRILALDVGHKRIGVALSDPLNIIAQGLTTLLRNAPEEDLEAIRQLVEQHEVKAIVVGLPVRLDGSVGPEAAKMQGFIDGLAAAVECAVHPWDERFTTVQAGRALLEGGVGR